MLAWFNICTLYLDTVILCLQRNEGMKILVIGLWITCWFFLCCLLFSIKKILFWYFKNNFSIF